MKTVIFGCGGHARSVANTLLENNKNEKILFVDSKAKTDEEIMGFAVEQNYKLDEGDVYIIAIGDNSVRKKMYDSLNGRGYGKCISVVSGTAHIGVLVCIGIGTFVAPYSCIGPCVCIGNDTIINSGSIVEHETIIGDHTHIAPHATVCGRSKIGDNVFCGAGSTVIDKISICNDVVIGAGAVVVKNITEPGTYVGIPASKTG